MEDLIIMSSIAQLIYVLMLLLIPLFIVIITIYISKGYTKVRDVITLLVMIEQHIDSIKETQEWLAKKEYEKEKRDE